MRTVDDTLTPTDHPLIGLDPRGRPWLYGSGPRVAMLVEGFFAPPVSTVESYVEDFPYLTAEKVRAALAYYAAHKDAVDEEIRRSAEEAERLKRATWDEAHQARLAKLKAEWKRPS